MNRFVGFGALKPPPTELCLIVMFEYCTLVLELELELELQGELELELEVYMGVVFLCYMKNHGDI